MKLAIVGITGTVGKVMLEVLKERKFPISELIAVASENSAGNKINYLNKEHTILSLEELLSKKIDLALFSAGAEISKNWAPKLAEQGIKVIDNSSYWRMCSKHKLIIPEINGAQIEKKDMIIANPNCSVIQLLMPLAPLHKKFNIQRVVVSTYQSVTGSGAKAIRQLKNEQSNITGEKEYPYIIHQNAIPHCDIFQENGYTKEEMKLTLETKKILDKNINLSATAVRVPIIGGHSESVNITFSKEITTKQIYSILEKTDGVQIIDDPLSNKYPMPIFAQGKDEVFVGRIRKDFTLPNTINMWIVADNLRKGAATNAVQIAEYLLVKKLL